MNDSGLTQQQVCCSFNGYCIKTLKHEAINAHRDIRHRQLHEVSFSNLTAREESQLCAYDTYFADSASEKSFYVGGKEITAEMLADALKSLPGKKRDIVMLYYFFDMSDEEIARSCNIPRSTVQYRRTSSFSQLKHFLEAYDNDR